MWYLFWFAMGAVTGVAATIFIASVAVSDPFPPSRTELGDYLRKHHG